MRRDLLRQETQYQATFRYHQAPPKIAFLDGLRMCKAWDRTKPQRSEGNVIRQEDKEGVRGQTWTLKWCARVGGVKPYILCGSPEEVF